MPELRRRYALVPTVKSLDCYRLVLILHTVYHDLAVFLELPHDVAYVLDAVLVGQHRTFVDDLVDPHSRYLGIFLTQVGVGPLGAVACKSFVAVTVACCHRSVPL